MHLDIGSRIDGFIAHILCFMSVTAVEIRTISSDVAGLTFIQGGATELVSVSGLSISSLSSLHAAEHFGLGQYSDSIDRWSRSTKTCSFADFVGLGMDDAVWNDDSTPMDQLSHLAQSNCVTLDDQFAQNQRAGSRPTESMLKDSTTALCPTSVDSAILPQARLP